MKDKALATATARAALVGVEIRVTTNDRNEAKSFVSLAEVDDFLARVEDSRPRRPAPGGLLDQVFAESKAAMELTVHLENGQAGER